MNDMTEEVVDQITEAAPDLVASLGKVKLQFGVLGAIFGAAGGAAAAWFIAYRKAELKYQKIADEEIEQMREHYHAKGVALEAQQGKGNLADLVKEKGYKSEEPEQFRSASPPMAVQPPSSVVESENDRAGEPQDDSAMAEDDVEGPDGVKPQTRNIFRERERTVPHEWNAADERKRRSPDRPYVIHQDERYDLEGYSEVSYTYYAKDDVLCDERDEIVDPDRRDDLIGEANLERFGHGCDDPMIVHIRNDNLEIVYEIIKSPNSFAEEVHGFTHEAYDRGNLERMRRRERDVET